MFMASIDLGFNLDNKKYSTTYNDYIDQNNYSIKTEILDPQYFMSITPHFYLKYFAIGCGIGYFELDKETEIDTKTGNGTSSSISGSSSSELTGYFMIRPSIKGFIPINDNLSLSLNAGYDYAFSFKECNGFNFGLGLQWVIED